MSHTGGGVIYKATYGDWKVQCMSSYGVIQSDKLIYSIAIYYWLFGPWYPIVGSCSSPRHFSPTQTYDNCMINVYWRCVDKTNMAQ